MARQDYWRQLARKLIFTPLLLFAIAFAMAAQEPARISEGKFKGFLPHSGNIIVQLGNPFKVREVCGLILFGSDPNVPAVGLVFEIRGPGSDMTIRSSVTDPNGHFCIAGVPEGTYLFKTSLKGCQGITGTIIKSHKAPRKNTVNFYEEVAN